MLAIKVPAEIGSLLAQVPVPERRESPTEYHITLLNVGDDFPLEQVSQAMIAAYQVVGQTKPFLVQTSLVTSFPGGDSGVPVIARVESPELHALQKALRGAFDGAGIDYSKKFPEFKPHVTLAYSQETPKDQKIPTVSWTVDEVCIFAGGKGETNIVVKLPFNMGNLDKAASLRVAARYQRYGCSR